MVRKVNRDAKLDSRARRNRHSDDRRVTQDRVLNDDDRLTEFRRQFHQDVLPSLPEIPDYHVCWLTTNNAQDPIQKRVRMGYEPIKASDIPGWQYASLKTGEWAGCIGINEMIAFKIPMFLYKEMMHIAHHDRPLQEEQGLRARVDQMRAAVAAEAGVRVDQVDVELDDGTEALGREAPRPPSFPD